MTDGALPLTAVEVLLRLTERALADGLDVARDEAAAALRGLGLDPAGGPVAVALADAVAVAQRVVGTVAADAAQVDELRAQARVDDLTGTLNRRAFFARLDDELARAGRYGGGVTLVLCDLDGFKAINDRFGHPAGDEALRSFAQRLEGNLRGSDSVGRIGGDEFGLVLIGADASDEGAILARLARSLLAGPPGAEDVQASFGAARFPEDGATRDELVAAADARLYEHKRRAR